MENHHPAVHLEGGQQIRDIAVPHKNLRVGPDHIIVQVIHHMGAAVASPHAEDGFDLRIREHLVDVRSPVLSLPRQIVVEIGQGGQLSSHLYLIAHLLKEPDAVGKLLLLDGEGGGHKAHGVPLI